MEKNEWEKNSANDSIGKSKWQNAMDPNSTYVSNGYDFGKPSDYMVKFEYAEKMGWTQKPSIWKRTKCAFSRAIKYLFVEAPVLAWESAKMVCHRRCKKSIIIAALEYDNSILRSERDTLKSSNEILKMMNANLTSTLSAWIEMDSAAFKEQLAQKKKAAKKRPSVKKRKG